MVSPAKTRTSAFSSLHEISPGATSAAGGGRAQNAQKLRSVSTKYDATRDATAADTKRLRRLVDYVKRSLEPFSRSNGATVHASVPAAETIHSFLDKIGAGAGADRGVVDAHDFCKCLSALGVSADDSVFLLEHLADRDRSGSISCQWFVKMFLSGKPTSFGNTTTATTTTAPRRRTNGYDDNNTTSTSSSEAFHQKVIERVLLRYANVKEAFRQYDTNRLGVLSAVQFRVFLRDLGFVGGRDVEALLRHLDARGGNGNSSSGGQPRVSFHAFAQQPASHVQSHSQSQSQASYAKSPPKRKFMQPLQDRHRRDLAASTSSPSISGGGGHDETTMMEIIRAKLRQRVIGRSKSIREIFMEFDADGNGHLDHREFAAFMAAYGFSHDETRVTISFLDQDFSGTIDYDEFASGLLFYRPSAGEAVAPRGLVMTEQQRQAKHGSYLLEVVKEKISLELRGRHRTVDFSTLRDQFAKFDTDDSGALDYQEFSAFLVSLGAKLSPRDLEALMVVVDSDASNQIEFHEFMKVFGQNDSPNFKSNHSSRSTERTYTRQSTTKDEVGGEEEKEKEGVRLEAVFSKYDLDGSGLLDFSEFRRLLHDHGVPESEIRQISSQFDLQQGDEGINVETFKSIVQLRGWNWSHSPTKLESKATGSRIRTSKKVSSSLQAENMLVTHILCDHQSLDDAFRQHDLDGSSELDRDEFRRFMKHYGLRDDHEIDVLIRKLDADGSGAVSLDEFMTHFQVKPTHRKVSTTTTTTGPSPTKRNSPSKSSTTSAQARAKKLAALRELTQVWVEGVLEHHASLEEAFRQYDTRQRNELDYEQFRDLMSQYGISDDGNVRLLLSQVDADQSGAVDLHEFLSFFQPRQATRNAKSKSGAKKEIPDTKGLAAEQAKARAVRLRLLEEQWITQALGAHGSVRRAFDQFDVDQSGSLDHDEFRELMMTYGVTRDEDISRMIQRLDLDGSGSIDYDEFASVFYERRVNKGQKDAGSTKVSGNVSSETVKSSSAARLRELELKWIKRALSCHASIEAAFSEYDRDGNGSLDRQAFTHCMKRYGIARDEDIARLIRRLDLDGSGTIDLSEFTTVFNPLRCSDSYRSLATIDNHYELDAEELASVMEIERELAERILKHTRDLRAAFRKFDLNGNGKLEYNEFRRVLKTHKFPEPEIRKVIRHLDRNVSGFIDYREFIAGFATVTDSGGNGSAGSSAGSSGMASPGARRKTSTMRGGPVLKSSLKKTTQPRNATAQRESVESLKKRLLDRILSVYGSVQATFRKYDTARNGALEPAQFEKMALALGFDPREAQFLLEHFDRDQSGSVEYEEFLTCLIADA